MTSGCYHWSVIVCADTTALAVALNEGESKGFEPISIAAAGDGRIVLTQKVLVNVHNLEAIREYEAAQAKAAGSEAILEGTPLANRAASIAAGKKPIRRQSGATHAGPRTVAGG
jgi:hypothetical protein